MKNYKDYKKIYLSKNKIKVLNYCKHGDLETTTRKMEYAKDSRNLCLKCSEEIINSDKNTKNLLKYEKVINILKNPSTKIAKNKLALWYPYLYKIIDQKKGKYWRQKIYMFLNKINNPPKCSCGNFISFDNKKNQFKNKCEKCNRSNATKKDSQEKSFKKWQSIFEEDFNIKNPEFKNKDKYNILIKINNEEIEISKKRIHHLRKGGILNADSIKSLSLNEIDFYTKELRNKWNFYKNLDEKTIKYRYPFVWKSLDIINKEKYHLNNFNELKFLVKNKIQEIPKCQICNNPVSFSSSNQRYNINCDKHKFIVFTSNQEKEIYAFIKNLYIGKIERNYRFNFGEIDIFIPELNIGIEFNGLYWHGEIYKDKDYHHKKAKNCNENNINLLTIWEDDWNYKKDIIKSIIRNKLGKNLYRIPGRKCNIKEINYYKTKSFLQKNHLQSECLSKVNIGLFYDDELVSVMTFGPKRMILNSKTTDLNKYELLRFCNKLNTSIIGGASKLFKYFINNYNPSEIISYANLDISNGKLYKILEFEKSKDIRLNFWWVKKGIKYHRSNFMKHKLIKEGWDSFKTADEIMHERGYYKIWGTGNLKWIYKK